MAGPSTARERKNWLIHLLYVRQDYDECMRVIEEQLRACNGLCEYPLYAKGEEVCGGCAGSLLPKRQAL
jgi:hypothetical protein